jgi:hypothetical protein
MRIHQRGALAALLVAVCALAAAARAGAAAAAVTAAPAAAPAAAAAAAAVPAPGAGEPAATHSSGGELLGVADLTGSDGDHSGAETAALEHEAAVHCAGLPVSYANRFDNPCAHG